MVTSNKVPDKKVVKMVDPISNEVVPQRTLLGEVNEHITCPLCRGYYIDATTIVECLHSFCRSCIIKHLNVKSYCPVCEMMINSAKPNIKPDKALQDIVYKLVPGLFQKEMERRQTFYSSRPGPAASATPEQRGEDTERIIFSPEDVISFSLEYADATDSDSISSKSSDSNEPPSTAGARRFMQCPAVVNISHLKKFLSMKFDIDSSLFAIDILYKRVPLPDYYTLMDIAYIYNWKRNEPMRFFYQIIDYVAIRNRILEINRKCSSMNENKASPVSNEDTSSPAPLLNDHISEASSGTDSPIPLHEENAKQIMQNKKDKFEQSKETFEKLNADRCHSFPKKNEDDVEKSQFLNSFELAPKSCSSTKTSPTKPVTTDAPSTSETKTVPAATKTQVATPKLDTPEKKQPEPIKRKQQTPTCATSLEQKRLKIELERTKITQILNNYANSAALANANTNANKGIEPKLTKTKVVETPTKNVPGTSSNIAKPQSSKEMKSPPTQSQLMDSPGIKRNSTAPHSVPTSKRKPALEGSAQQSPLQQISQSQLQQTSQSPLQQISQSSLQQTSQSSLQQTSQSSLQQTSQSSLQQTSQSSLQQTSQSSLQQTSQSPLQQTSQSSLQQPSQSPLQQTSQAKPVSPLKIQVPKLESQISITKTPETPKPQIKKMPDLKPSIPLPSQSLQNKTTSLNKVRMDLLANNSDPTMDRSKILSQVKTSLMSPQNAAPVSGDPLKSLFDSCKINIPSSLSITLFDQKVESRNTGDSGNSDPKKISNKIVPGPSNSLHHKVPAAPTMPNHIEIMKIPDSDPKKSGKDIGTELKPTVQNKTDSTPGPAKPTNKAETSSAKGPVPNLKPIAETKLAKQASIANFIGPITFQQTFEQQLQSLQGEKKSKLQKLKSQVPKLVPATPKSLSAANKPATFLNKPTTGDCKPAAALDLSSASPNAGGPSSVPQQAFDKTLETMQSIANLAKKQSLPPKGTPLQTGQFSSMSTRPVPAGISPLGHVTNISQIKLDKVIPTASMINIARQETINKSNLMKQSSNLGQTPSTPSSSYTMPSAHASPRHTRSPSSSPKLVIAEEKQASNTPHEQSLNQSNQITSTQLTSMSAPKSEPGPSKPIFKSQKTYTPTGKLPLPSRQPITQTIKPSPTSMPNMATSMPSMADFQNYRPQLAVAQHALMRHQMENQWNAAWIKAQRQYDFDMFKSMTNMVHQAQSDYNNKDKQ